MVISVPLLFATALALVTPPFFFFLVLLLRYGSLVCPRIADGRTVVLTLSGPTWHEKCHEKLVSNVLRFVLATHFLSPPLPSPPQLLSNGQGVLLYLCFQFTGKLIVPLDTHISSSLLSLPNSFRMSHVLPSHPPHSHSSSHASFCVCLYPCCT